MRKGTGPEVLGFEDLRPPNISLLSARWSALDEVV